MTKLDIQKLKDKVRCPVLQAGDDGYDEARVIWNGMIDTKPRLIVLKDKYEPDNLFHMNQNIKPTNS